MGTIRNIKSLHHVFIVDDSPMYRELVKNEVSKIEGIQVSTFKSAEECFNSGLTLPELVILDLYLDDGSNSVMSGHDALQKFYSMDENVKVVLISAEINETLLEEYKSYRGVDFILKSTEIENDIASMVKNKLYIS